MSKLFNAQRALDSTRTGGPVATSMAKGWVIIFAAVVFAGCVDNVGSPLAGGSASSSLAPAALQLVSANISKGKINLGETLELSFSLRNAGQQDGAYAIQFLVDGQVKEEKTFRMIAGGQETSSFAFSPTGKGDFSLSLASTALGGRATTTAFGGPWKVHVSLAAHLVVTGVDVSNREAEVGSSITVSAKVTNEGEETGTKTIKFFVNGQVSETKDLSAKGSEQVVATFVYSNSAKGSYSLRVDDFDAGSVQFYLPARFEVSSFTASQTAVDAGDAITFSYDLRNTGDRAGTTQVAVSFDAATVYGKSEDIGPQGSASRQTSSTTATSGGTKTASISLDGNVAKSLQITVRPPDPAARNIQTPYNSDSACYDEAYTSITAVNRGTGKAHHMRVEFWVDGEQHSFTMGSSSTAYNYWNLGEVAAGASQASGSVTILGVRDDCGSTDCHYMKVKVFADYVSTWTSDRYDFCV